MKPKIEIIIPVYNAEKFLPEAIESLLAQTYSNIEIIVIDDGSTDKTSEIAKSYKEVNYFYQSNQGPGSARNRGIELANSEFVGFHDADDICEKERIGAQMELLLQNPSLEITYSRIKNFIEPNSNVPDFLKTEVLMQARMGFISAAVMRKSVFNKVGLFNQNLKIGEDIDWISRADMKQICACSLPEVLIRRRLHSNNLSTDLKQGYKNLFDILRKKISG